MSRDRHECWVGKRPNYSYRSAPPACSRATLARPERTQQSCLPARPTCTAAVALGIALPGCLVRDLADLPQGRCSIASSERGNSRAIDQSRREYLRRARYALASLPILRRLGRFILSCCAFSTPPVSIGCRAAPHARRLLAQGRSGLSGHWRWLVTRPQRLMRVEEQRQSSRARWPLARVVTRPQSATQLRAGLLKPRLSRFRLHQKR